MNNLYEALEICLQDLENGADVESVLFRYPDLADELRPILEASAGARSMAAPIPSAEVVQRNRAKILQHAAQVREARAGSSRRVWFASLRRLAVTLAVVAALFISGTGLVRAAANTLPGDNLYPVKRTWEGLSLFLTFNPQLRETLEVEHENERVYEVQTLLAEGRSAEVDFSGWVTSQNGNEWTVSPGVKVVLTDQTEIRDGPIGVGSAIRVRGQTQANGIVLVERIRLLESDDQLPTIGEQPEIDSENNNEGTSEPGEDNSGPGSGDETPEFEPREESFEGIVVSIENNVVVVNGIEADISRAEIRGTPVIGASVKVDGYYDSNGVFIVTRIEFEDDDSGGNSSEPRDSNDNSGSNDNSASGENDNGGNDNNNNDSGSNSGSSNGDNSGSGGGGNSGPGGGGDGSED